MFVEWFSFTVLSVAALAVGAALRTTPTLRAVGNLVIAGAVLRIVGVFARHAMIFDIYSGMGDAVGYFDAGRVLADHFRALDFSIIGSGQWGDREWGTQAIRYASGVVIAFVGPSMRASFLVFSLAAFAGLACMAIAFGRCSRSGSMRRCAMLLFFWPTLWFWPSSIGKEAVLLLAIGLVTLGYTGRFERIHWIPMIAGLALALVIRPHLAGVLAASTCVAEWAAPRWTFRRLAQSVLTTALATCLIVVALGLLGLATPNPDTLQAFILETAEHTNHGGSAFERTSTSGAAAIPMAFINILGRPFVTEAHNPMALVSSLEMMAFWGLIIHGRRQLASVLWTWRSHRLLRFAILFSVLYVLMVGVTFQNLGIIARQRTLVMPLLLIVAAASTTQKRRSKTVQLRRVWQASTPSFVGACRQA